MHRFDFLMLPCQIHQLTRRCIPAGEVIACLFTVVSMGICNPLNHKYTLQLGPVEPGNIGSFAVNSLFDSPCVFLHRLAAFPLVAVDRILKKRADIRQQRGMIALQSKQIIPFTPHNPAASFPLTVHSVCRDSLARYIQICQHFLKN